MLLSQQCLFPLTVRISTLLWLHGYPIKIIALHQAVVYRSWTISNLWLVFSAHTKTRSNTNSKENSITPQLTTSANLSTSPRDSSECAAVAFELTSRFSRRFYSTSLQKSAEESLTIKNSDQSRRNANGKFRLPQVGWHWLYRLLLNFYYERNQMINVTKPEICQSDACMALKNLVPITFSRASPLWVILLYIRFLPVFLKWIPGKTVKSVESIPWWISSMKSSILRLRTTLDTNFIL